MKKMWLEDKYFEIKESPEKRAKFFKFAWITAYSMLLLGAALIVWVLAQGY